MKTLRMLYHMARADFLERTRRYSFLVMLALVIWIGYTSASGQMIMRIYPDYTGVQSSAWVGTLMALTASFFLGWFGFYLVKGSVNRDYETGVGQIMATTPISRPLYTLGKWGSNFAVLAIMVVVLAVVGALTILWRGEYALEAWALLSPLLFVALPGVALVAALAVFFECIHWLRGGMGNVLYFFLFTVLMVLSIESRAALPVFDFTGFRLIGDSVASAARAVYPESSGAFTFTITTLAQPKLFPFEGIPWTSDVILARIFILAVGLFTALLGAVFFDRFNPSRLLAPKKKRGAASPVAPDEQTQPAPHQVPAASGITPLTGARGFRFGALYRAELKLLLKGQRWWWFAVAAGLIIAQFVEEMETAKILLAVAWIWPVLILGGMGSRENRHNTGQIVFSAPNPLRNQLPAAFLAALTLMVLLGGGVLLRSLLAGEPHHLLAWAAGALFVPALALASGVLSGGSKAFEVMYVLLWYIGPIQKTPAFDFIGVSGQGPWPVYAGCAVGLLLLAALTRKHQLTHR